MKKRNKKLRICAGILAFVLIGFLLYGLREFYGDPIQKYLAEKTLTAYAKQHHDDLDDFSYEGVGYNFKDGSYHATYVHKKQPKLSFYISVRGNDEPYDSYEFDYVLGSNGWALYANEVLDTIDETIMNACDASFGICIGDVDSERIREEEKNMFYENKHVDQLKVITISGSIRLPDLTDTANIVEQFKKMASIFEGHDQAIKSYTLSVFDETGNSGFDVCNVTKERLYQPGFQEELQRSLQLGKDVDSNAGYYIRILESK